MIINSTLHHIGVASENALLESEQWRQMLGFKIVSDLTYDPVQKVNVLFLSDGNKNGILLELVEPAAEDSPVKTFLEKGSRFYHICHEVDDIEIALAQIRSQGALIIQQPVSATAFRGRRIAWCYTRTKHLIELLERGMESIVSEDD
jgi:methylmalonyl-CoA/ethylmalonyl-CoA epimerase